MVSQERHVSGLPWQVRQGAEHSKVEVWSELSSIKKSPVFTSTSQGLLSVNEDVGLTTPEIVMSIVLPAGTEAAKALEMVTLLLVGTQPKPAVKKFYSQARVAVENSAGMLIVIVVVVGYSFSLTKFKV